MGSYSILREHTLVMAGDSVDSATVWQGWPATNSLTLEQYYEELFSSR